MQSCPQSLGKAFPVDTVSTGAVRLYGGHWVRALVFAVFHQLHIFSNFLCYAPMCASHPEVSMVIAVEATDYRRNQHLVNS